MSYFLSDYGIHKSPVFHMPLHFDTKLQTQLFLGNISYPVKSNMPLNVWRQVF